MSVELVLTVLSRDHPGVVESVAATITTHSGNWIDSSMSRLGGEFAGILRVSIAEESVNGLIAALENLSGQGIEIVVHRGREKRTDAGDLVRLSLTGLDHPGIVLEVTRCLAGIGANIENLHTEVFAGSMGGEAMFSATADITLPDNVNADEMRDALEELAQDIMVELDLKETAG